MVDIPIRRQKMGNCMITDDRERLDDRGVAIHFLTVNQHRKSQYLKTTTMFLVLKVGEISLVPFLLYIN